MTTRVNRLRQSPDGYPIVDLLSTSIPDSIIRVMFTGAERVFLMAGEGYDHESGQPHFVPPLTINRIEHQLNCELFLHPDGTWSRRQPGGAYGFYRLRRKDRIYPDQASGSANDKAMNLVDEVIAWLSSGNLAFILRDRAKHADLTSEFTRATAKVADAMDALLAAREALTTAKRQAEAHRLADPRSIEELAEVFAK